MLDDKAFQEAMQEGNVEKAMREALALNKLQSRARRLGWTGTGPMPPMRPYEIEVKQVEGDLSAFRPRPWDEVINCYQGDDYMTMKYIHKPVKTHIKRIDATHYKDLKTGEIKEYQVNTEEERQLVRRTSLKRTFEELTGLLRTNFVGAGQAGENSQLFITLTYRENMTDTAKLFVDFELFMKKLTREYPHEYVYIAVMEPQGRGAWHVHLMLKALDTDWLWLDKEEISRIWGDENIKIKAEADGVPLPKGYRLKEGHGYTSTARLKSNDVGAYYTTYFTGVLRETYTDGYLQRTSTGEEVLLDEELLQRWAAVTGDDKRVSKAVVKGKRLSMYPKHFKFYRCSQNVSRPEKVKEMALSSNEMNKELVFERAFVINKRHLEGEQAGEVEELNKVYRATYRSKGRQNKK